MRTSISHIKDHLTCPQLAHNRHVLLRGAPTDSVALGVGTLWHLAMACELDPSQARWEQFATAIELEATIPVLSAWEALSPAREAWRKPADWSVKFVEKELEVPCGRHSIVGTLDAIVEWNGSAWHLQHKTLAPSVPLDVFAEQQRLDFHELAYHRMMLGVTTLPIGGTILNVCRKLSAKTIRETPTAALSIQYLPRKASEVADGMRDLAQVLDDMELSSLKTVPRARAPIRNRSACAGPYRNHLCEYIAVCRGDCGLDDPRFVDLPNRYPVEGA